MPAGQPGGWALLSSKLGERCCLEDKNIISTALLFQKYYFFKCIYSAKYHLKDWLQVINVISPSGSQISSPQHTSPAEAVTAAVPEATQGTQAPHTRANQRSSQPSSPPLASVNGRGRLCPSAGCVSQQGCPDEHELLLPSSSHLQPLFHLCQWISAGEGQPGDSGVHKCCTGCPTLLCAVITRGTSSPLSPTPTSSQMNMFAWY